MKEWKLEGLNRKEMATLSIRLKLPASGHPWERMVSLNTEAETLEGGIGCLCSDEDKERISDGFCLWDMKMRKHFKRLESTRELEVYCDTKLRKTVI